MADPVDIRPTPNTTADPNPTPTSHSNFNPRAVPAPAFTPTPALTPIPVIGFVAPSGTGKTTLIRQLVPRLRQRGLRVGYLKHSHHRIEVDRPGKDSYEIREAGASQVLLATGERWIMQSVQHRPGPDTDHDQDPSPSQDQGPDQDPGQGRDQDQGRKQEQGPDKDQGPDQSPGADRDPDLAEMLALFDPRLVDLILVEGFKFSAYPKLEVHRAALAKPYLYPGDPAIRALISDGPPPAGDHPPLLPLGEPAAVVDYLLSLLSLPSAPPATFASSAPPEPSPTSPSPPQS